MSGGYLCPKCGEVRAEDEFYDRGKTDRANYGCIYCRRRMMMDRIQPRWDIVNAIKLERGCEDDRCAGYPADEPSVLDFDHRPGVDKLFNVAASMSRWTFDVWHRKVMAEITKCDVVCANCHRLRTRERYDGLGPRGDREPPPSPQMTLSDVEGVA
jgi:hypothetical protein